MSLNNNKHIHTSTLDSLPNDISFRSTNFFINIFRSLFPKLR